MKEMCRFPEGLTIRPDGMRELSPHRFKLREVHKNVTATLMRCLHCGVEEIEWRPQPDSEHEYIGGPIVDGDVIEGPGDCVFQDEHVYRNATVEVLECQNCGYVSVWWKPQPDTEEIEI